MSSVLVADYICPKCKSRNIIFEGYSMTYDCMDCKYNKCEEVGQ